MGLGTRCNMKDLGRYGILPVMVLLLSSCVAGTSLRTAEHTDEAAVSGTYTLILYGARYRDDFETAAFLDIEGDAYTIKPRAAEFEFESVSALSGKDAFLRAREFVSHHDDFFKTGTKRILDEEGATIGYEVKPIYALSAVSVVTAYWLLDGAVVSVNVRISPFLREPAYMQDDDPGRNP